MAGDLDDFIHLMEDSHDLFFYNRKFPQKKKFTGYIESTQGLEKKILDVMAQDMANIIGKPVQLQARQVQCDFDVKEQILEKMISGDAVESIIQLGKEIYIGMENKNDFWGSNGNGKLFQELQLALPDYEILVDESKPIRVNKIPNEGPLSERLRMNMEIEPLEKLLPKSMWALKPSFENGKINISYYNQSFSEKQLRKVLEKIAGATKHKFEINKEQADHNFVLDKILNSIPNGVIVKNLEYYDLHRYCTFLVRYKDKNVFKRWKRRISKSLNIDIFYQKNWLSDRLMELGNGTGVLKKASEFNKHIKRILKEKEIDFTRVNILPNSIRKDYADLVCFTVDPEGSKDFDDAISIEHDGTNYRLGVHIADVSSFIDHNSKLDKYARKRIETIYGSTHTLTMLPKDLSYLDLSLNAGEKKDTFSIFFTLNNLMKITGYNIERTKIKSRADLHYDLADQILQGREHELKGEIDLLSRVAANLNDQRREEYNVIFDKKSAMKNAIMECMLIANKTVAMHLENFHVDFPFRVHQSPDDDLKEKIVKKIEGIGIKVDMNNLEEKNVREYLRTLQKRNPLIASIIIDEFVGRAYYSLKNEGHFSLGFKSYTHFTSPIRRYADILVHRQLSAHLFGTKMIAKEELKQIIAEQNKRYYTVDERNSELNFYDQIKNFLSKKDKTMDVRISDINPDRVMVYCNKIDSNGILQLGPNQKIMEHKNGNYQLVAHGHKLYKGHKLNLKLVGFSLSHELPCFSLNP